MLASIGRVTPNDDEYQKFRYTVLEYHNSFAVSILIACMLAKELDF